MTNMQTLLFVFILPVLAFFAGMWFEQLRRSGGPKL